MLLLLLTARLISLAQLESRILTENKIMLIQAEVPGVARGILNKSNIKNSVVEFCLTYFTPRVHVSFLKNSANSVQPFGQL